MTELARGSISDRPWGRTLAALGLRGVSGELVIHGDGKRYAVVFDQGAVVAAASPLATDAAVRIAMTGGLVSSSQVTDIVRRQQAERDRDEVDIIAAAAKLSPEQAQRLRRRVVAHRAARTFSIERGEFVVDDLVTLPVMPGAELDIRAIIYLGARGNLSEQRLGVELGQFGVWFKIKPERTDDLPQFGIGPHELALLQHLEHGATLAELEHRHASIEQRTVRALVYSLVACGVADAEARARAPAPPPIDAPTVRRPGTPPPPEDPPTHMHKRPPSAELEDPPTQRKGVAPPTGAAAPVVQRAVPKQQQPPPKPRVQGSTLNADDVLAVIQQRIEMMDSGADHYALLGVEREASLEVVRKGYFALARQLHPDKLSALGIDDSGRHAQKLFAHVNAAFAELSDPEQRTKYNDVLRRGGAAAIAAEQAKAEEMTMRVLDAEEAFRKGELALRRDAHETAIKEFTQAIALNPDEPDYHALLAWAQFCGSPDKMAAGPATRAALEKGIAQAPRGVEARFYLGRVERMLGRDQEALRHFKEVLQHRPSHAEASTEIRVIEQRMKR